MDTKRTDPDNQRLITFAAKVVAEINSSYNYWYGTETERKITVPMFDKNQVHKLIDMFSNDSTE